MYIILHVLDIILYIRNGGKRQKRKRFLANNMYERDHMLLSWSSVRGFISRDVWWSVKHWCMMCAHTHPKIPQNNNQMIEHI